MRPNPENDPGVSRRRFLQWVGAGTAAVAGGFPALLPRLAEAQPDGAPRKPNIIVFFADDMGLGDVGVYGCKDIPTPNIDSIAANGVLFTDGYVSCPQCAPSRAALLTGRYQNRFGFEYNYNNAVPEDEEISGLPLTEETIADRLKEANYAAGIIAKWHQGETEKYHPLNRGFDYFFGHVTGLSSYLPREGQTSIPYLFRNRESVQVSEYLTDVFGREVVDFIHRHKEEPFFLYVPFNAPHGPLQATEKYLERVKDIPDKTRRTYAAMVSAMDDAIGDALGKLRLEGLEKDTLVFFLTDNGGRIGLGGENGIYRGGKGTIYEGGIRVPFVAQWPAVLPAGVKYEYPVTSRDILPTAAAAAGHPAQSNWKLDGVDLTPYLTGKKSGSPHENEALCWRLAVRPKGPDDVPWAVRMGDWKLIGVRSSSVKEGQPNRLLYNLASDPEEKDSLLEKHPDIAQRLETAYCKWEAEMAPPAWRLKPAIKREAK